MEDLRKYEYNKINNVMTELDTNEDKICNLLEVMAKLLVDVKQEIKELKEITNERR